MIQLQVKPMNDAASMELQRKQDARLRRFLLALPVYGAMALLLFLSSKNGLIVATAAGHGIAAMVVVNILLFLAL